MDPAVVGAGVRQRLEDLRAVIERQSAFVFGPGDGPPGSDVAGRPVARDFVLRTLGAASDSLNYGLLSHLEATDAGFADVCRHLDLGGVAAWERINDLVQAGLLARAPDRDQIGLTATGRELVHFVEAAAEAAEAGAEVER